MPTNCLSVFDHFLGLALKGLIELTIMRLPVLIQRRIQDLLKHLRWSFFFFFLLASEANSEAFFFFLLKIPFNIDMFEKVLNTPTEDVNRTKNRMLKDKLKNIKQRRVNYY